MPKIAESVAPLQTHEQDGIERRAAERYPSQAEASCHSAVASNITAFPTRIQNVSTSGIALVLGRRFQRLARTRWPGDERQDCPGADRY